MKEHSLAHRAYISLRDEIIFQALPPGSMIIESVYGEKLGMSRTPVREALKQLDGEGFISIIPHRGAVVKDYSLKDMIMCHEIAKEVDGALAYSLATSIKSGSMQPSALEPLFNLTAQMNEVLLAGNYTQWVALDNTFHTSLIELCENPYIVMCAQQLRLHLIRLSWFITPQHINKTISHQEHISMLNYIAKGEAKLAGKTAKKQSERSLAELTAAYDALRNQATQMAKTNTPK